MATYKVTAPDGTKFKVTAPDDATPGQVHEYAVQQFAAMKAKPVAAKAEKAAAPPPKTSAGNSFIDNYMDTLLLGGGAEAKGLTNALNTSVVNLVHGRAPGWSDAFNKGYNDFTALHKAEQEQHPNASAAGSVGGGVHSLAVPVGPVAAAATRTGRVLRAAGTGAGLAGASAALHSEGPQNRAVNAMVAAPFGAAIGAVAPAALSLVGRVTAPFTERVGGYIRDRISPNAMSGVNAMARRVGFDPVQMRQRAAEFRANGVNPTLVDVTDETGRGMIASAARRQTPAREAAQRYAEARAYDLPNRISRQARTHISGDPRTPDAIAETATNIRDANVASAMDPIRNAPVPTQDVLPILGTGEGQSAIRHAIKLETDPDARSVMKAVLKYARKPPKGDVIPPEIDKLGEPARSKAIEQLGLSETPPPPPDMTLDIVDKIRRGFKGAAGRAYRGNDAGRGRVLTDFGNNLRDHARTHVPEYGPILDRYGQESDLVNAVRTGEGFMDRNTDEFVAAANNLTPEERLLARPAARRAIERKAGENVSAAPGVARTLSISPEQHARNVALLGEEGAARLESGMGAEFTSARNAAQIAPNTGSPTQLRSEDDKMAGDALHAVASLATGGKTGALYAARMFVARHTGMRNEDAQRLVEMAIDPARTDEAIAQLERRMGRQQAGILVNGIRRLAARSAGDNMGDQ